MLTRHIERSRRPFSGATDLSVTPGGLGTFTQTQCITNAPVDPNRPVIMESFLSEQTRWNHKTANF